MTKKLLMNNYSENDEIILCEKYTPTNIPIYVWKDKKIDWDNYELYINLNIDGNTFPNWTSALCISSDDNIVSWDSTGDNGKIHIYYSANQIRLQPVSKRGCSQVDKSLTFYNNKKMQIIINKNGIYLENQLIMNLGDRILQDVIKCLKTFDITTIGINALGCTYNKISIRKYQERG